MKLEKISKEVLFDKKLEAVAGFTHEEKDILNWMRETFKKHETVEPGFPATVHTENSIIEALNYIAEHRSEFFGYEVIKQLGKREQYYLMDSTGKIVGRIQYVDDRI